MQVLMEGKTEPEYQAVLEHLRRLVPQFRPRRIMTDFELSLQNAWRTVFPNVPISGCYWHYCRVCIVELQTNMSFLLKEQLRNYGNYNMAFFPQAILKKAKELGLTAFSRRNLRNRSLLRSFLGIPLLPQHMIVRGFATLVTEAQRLGVLVELGGFITYFMKTWLTQPYFQTLSVFRLKHRTNNLCESCNKLLRSKTGAHKPGLWHFLSKQPYLQGYCKVRILLSKSMFAFLSIFLHFLYP